MLNKIKSKYRENLKRAAIIAGMSIFVLAAVTLGASLALQPSKTSQKKPYSVRIQSYRTAKDAHHAIKRLGRAGISAYTLKRMEKNNDIWIDVHTGAFAEKAQADVALKELNAKGLAESKTISFADIEKSVKAFDEAPSAEKREYKLPSAEIPKMADAMLTNLRHFPIDENYKVINLKLADSVTAPRNAFWNYFNFNYNYVPAKNTITNMMKDTNAVAQAIYEDKVFGWRAGVVILGAKNSAITMQEIIKVGGDKLGKVTHENLSFSTDEGELRGKLFVTADKAPWLTFIGEFPKTNHVLTLVSKDLTTELFLELARADNDAKGLLIFPEVRYNLSIMPKGDSAAVFTHFELKRVGWDYAREKGYAWWANNLVNYWNADGYFMQGERPFMIGFFNVNYDATAKKIHDNFMYEKSKLSANEFAVAMMREMGMSSYASKVREGANGWYMGKPDGNELSFSKGSVVVAIDAYRQSMGHEDLKTVANSLQIW